VAPKLPVTMDTKGRVRTSKEQRRVILAEFERSGVSASRFARPTTKLYLRAEAQALLTDGVDLSGAKLRPWYEREA
jgi:hypothetical protein